MRNLTAFQQQTVDEIVAALNRPDVVPVYGDWLREVEDEGASVYAACAAGGLALARSFSRSGLPVNHDQMEQYLCDQGVTHLEQMALSDGYEAPTAFDLKDDAVRVEKCESDAEDRSSFPGFDPESYTAWWEIGFAVRARVHATYHRDL